MHKSQIVFTCQAESSELCLNELISAIDGAGLVRWLGGGAGLLEADGDFDGISVQLRQRRPIFTRHMFPADHVIDIDGPGAIDRVTGAVAALASAMDGVHAANKPCSVQIRALTPGQSPLTPGDISPAASAMLCGMGFTLNVSAPRSIISIAICGGLIYMGLSDPLSCLSSWPGGMRHYAKYDGQISRAEFKLLEALEACGLTLVPDAGRRALDLGAAPGGWTKVLLDMGWRVTAVDPAKLSPALAGQAGLEHRKTTAQTFLRYADARLYDMIVNDMRMDIKPSSQVMLDAYDLLAGSGHVIMTFKLPPSKKLAAINKGLEMLSAKYEIMMAKQLFHNRSEITVVLRKTTGR